MSGEWGGLPTMSGLSLRLLSSPMRPGSAAIWCSRGSSAFPRVDAALNAVPAAVLTTLVAPAAVFNGTAETLTLAVCLLIGLRIPMMAMFAIGWAMIVALRAAGL
jgi:uncharacterized membrane protein